MSTEKFNIHEMGQGNDVHSDFLIRKGYGNLLNRPGRQEITLDTASMYKSAGDASTMLTGAGAAAGGLAGNLLADYTDTGATGRLIMMLAGAGLGGFGGYTAGKHMDSTMEDGMSMTHRNRNKINAAAIGSLGALAGYGTSKYVMGSKNKLHNLIGAVAGGAIGAGLGSHIADNKTTSSADKEILDIADDMGLQGDQRENFIRDYTAALSEEKNKGFANEWYYTLIGNNPTEMDKVKAKYSGKTIPEESVRGLNTAWKVPLGIETGYAAARALGAGGRSVVKGSTPGTIPQYVLSRANWYKRNAKHTARAGKALFNIIKKLVVRR